MRIRPARGSTDHIGKVVVEVQHQYMANIRSENLGRVCVIASKEL